MKALGKLIVAGVFAFVLVQFVRPTIPAKPATAELQVPPEIRHILDKDCYSCHSDQRRLLWFDQIVPAYWLVRHDILTARQHLNFSTLGAKPDAMQKATLYEGVNMMQLGAMPLPSFVQLHPEAKVTPEELATFKAYLAPWSTPPSVAITKPENSTPVSLATIQSEFNGLPFDPAFKDWKLISITDRGDNNTFRFILGNDLALKAAQTGHVSPWPDGARFAKIAWQQEPGADGLIHAGKFVQVELMVKNASLYKDSEGWGWGRWRGMDLKPYGKDAQFVTECTGCHQPLAGNDYVYSLPISTAKVSRQEAINNAAALPSSLPYQPLAWHPVTMYVDPNSHTMATLFADGQVLALVTWAQREDPHWFGARIPDAPKSVEFVQISGNGHNGYRHFVGPGLVEDFDTANPTARAKFMTDLIPAHTP